jgi:hypothetical protein
MNNKSKHSFSQNPLDTINLQKFTCFTCYQLKSTEVYFLHEQKSKQKFSQNVLGTLHTQNFTGGFLPNQLNIIS